MLSAKNIDNGQITYDGRLITENDFINENRRTNIKSGDVLLTIVGSIGRSAVVPDDSPPFTLQRSVAVIKPITMLSKFLMYQFQSPRFQKALILKARGTAQMGVYLNALSKIEVLVPPLNEQIRIVARIEELFSHLDAGVAALERAKANLKRYRASVLKAAVEGKLTEQWRKEHPPEETASQLLTRILKQRRKKWEEEQLEKFRTRQTGPPKKWRDKYKEPTPPDTTNLPNLPEGWCWATTDSLFEFVTSGSRGWAKFYSDEGAIFLRIGNLDHMSISLDLEKIQRVNISGSRTEGMRTRVQPYDILISITADTGMIGIVPEQFEEAYINQHIALTRPSNQINPHYLAWFLASEQGQKQFKALQRGATKVGLGLDDIRSINVPLPPLREQKKIVIEIERRFSVSDVAENGLYKGIKRATRLRQAILKRAFEGRLV